MFTKEEPITLTNIGDGVAIELFQEELQKVLDNIVDMNTKAKAVREINLKVRIMPDDDRQIGDIEILPTSKLAPTKSYSSRCMIGRTGTTGHARELATQRSLFNDGEKENVVGIDTATGEITGEGE